MRTIRTLVALVAVLGAVPALAQGGAGAPGAPGAQRGGMQQRQFEVLFRGITLTQAQQAVVDSLQTANREAMRALMAGGGMQDPANREKARQSREALFEEMRKVLNPDQARQYDENRRAMQQMGGPQGGQRPPE